MKAVICLVFFTIFAIARAKPSGDDHYTTKYDNVDIDTIIRNDRLLRNYVDCLLGTKKCTKDGDELKKAVPDALKNGCSRCNKIQQINVRKMLHHLIEKKRDWYKELESVYDSEGVYRKQYEAEAKKEGLKL